MHFHVHFQFVKAILTIYFCLCSEFLNLAENGVITAELIQQLINDQANDQDASADDDQSSPIVPMTADDVEKAIADMKQSKGKPEKAVKGAKQTDFRKALFDVLKRSWGRLPRANNGILEKVPVWYRVLDGTYEEIQKLFAEEMHKFLFSGKAAMTIGDRQVALISQEGLSSYLLLL